MTVLVIAETEKNAIDLCAGARIFGGSVSLMVFSPDAARTGIADACYVVPVPEGSPVEDASATVASFVKDNGVTVVLAEPTRRMKVIAGKVAAQNGVSVIVEPSVIKDLVGTSLYFGGVATRAQKSAGDLTVFVCTGAPFDNAVPSGTDVVETLTWVANESAVKVLGREPLPPAGVDLPAAKNIVAAGRGFSKEEQLQLAKDLAAKIGAEIGCTRPLAEVEHWLSRESYIGVSGVMLSPDVYVGIGISGQMQHMVGVNTSRVAFAVNKDKNAPIFTQVDYGLVGDLEDVLPALIDAL